MVDEIHTEGLVKRKMNTM